MYVTQFSFYRDVEGAAAIQQALLGENIQEKERRLSEMILQLQMFREQLISQQQQQQQHPQHSPEQSKVSAFFIFIHKRYFND